VEGWLGINGNNRFLPLYQKATPKIGHFAIERS